MKKQVSVLLCLAILLSLLCACAVTPPKEEDSSGEYVIHDPALQVTTKTEDHARVFYEIFVGSFSDSDNDGVGDLRGIINRMDYLNDGDPNSGRSLGIEGIWLTPIFKSPTYHKYGVSDYYTIDPKFGTMDDLRDLIQICHERNVLLILDLTLNHSGDLNDWFGKFVLAHRQGDTSSDFYNFYSWAGPGHPGMPGHAYHQISGSEDSYECNFADSMPEYDMDNEVARQALLDVGRYYLDMGVDGFRVDAAKYVYYGDNRESAAFMKWYADELRKYCPGVYMVGEVWDADAVIDEYYGAMNCFNFSVSQAEGLIAKAAAGSGVSNYTRYVDDYLDAVRARRDDATIMPFVSNHDMDRAAGFLPVSNGRMMMAANVYLLGPGSPFIYYGEELGVKGSRGGSNTDANRRLAMPWGDRYTPHDPIGSDYPEKNRLKTTAREQLSDPYSLYTYYKTLLMIRHANPEIARGDYTALRSGSLGGFVSEWEGRAVCVLHNTTTDEQSVDLSSLSQHGFNVLAASVGLGEASLDGTVLTLGPQTSAVLRVG